MFKIEVTAPIPLETLLNDFQPDGTDPTTEELPEPKDAKEKKKKLVIEFEDAQLYDQVKGQIEDLKKDQGVESEAAVLDYLLKSDYDPRAIDGMDAPPSQSVTE